MKKLSCGVIVKDNQNRILACHPTGRPNFDGNYDLPKGIHEENESEMDTAIRELYEETNLQIPDNSMLKDLGTFEYLKDKDLHLWMFNLNNSFDNIRNELKCNSRFELKGASVPEVNYYIFADKIETFYPSIQKVLRQIGGLYE